MYCEPVAGYLTSMPTHLASASLNASTAREVRAEMSRQGISQVELAKAIGIAQNSISRRLTGKVPFSLPEIESIAQVLDVPVDQLLPAIRRAL